MEDVKGKMEDGKTCRYSKWKNKSPVISIELGSAVLWRERENFYEKQAVFPRAKDLSSRSRSFPTQVRRDDKRELVVS